MKITLETGQNVFFTADTHYSHHNICSATTNWVNPPTLRDFKSLDAMNDRIVNNINTLVGENDILFHLGDWSFGGFDKIAEFRNRLLCKNIHLILGNHDHHIERNKEGIRDLFSSVTHYTRLTVVKQLSRNSNVKFNFVLFHFPIASWDNMNQNVIHLHGHTHLNEVDRVGKGKSLDVGMDGNILYPILMEKICNRLERNPIDNLVLPKDHHKDELI
jgi:calcineurin-like phosphoesterase family protein